LLILLLQGQALKVDNQRNAEVFDPSNRKFLRELMGDDGHQWKEESGSYAITKLMKAPPSHGQLSLMGKMVFPYVLLNIYARALEVPCHHEIVAMPRLPRPTYDIRRLNLVCFTLNLLQLLIFFVSFMTPFVIGENRSATLSPSTIPPRL
jgi:hypothetical protein